MLLQPSRIKTRTVYTYSGLYDTYLIWPFSVGDRIRYFRGTIYDAKISNRIEKVEYDSISRDYWKSREVETINNPAVIQQFVNGIANYCLNVMINCRESNIPMEQSMMHDIDEFPIPVKRLMIHKLFTEFE